MGFTVPPPPIATFRGNRHSPATRSRTSSFRPRLLRVLRDKQVHATFFDNGVRVLANPQIARFQVAEGHVELNHTATDLHALRSYWSAGR
jgi:peptidoglycan/xylan/chitin deacetylase (PgdA/CDA1 family)